MKRRIKSWKVMLFVFSLLLGVGHYAVAGEKGLVGYWKFDEESGNIAKDSSGTGNNGTIHGATFVEGISGKALSFDGKDDYVKVSSSESLNITEAISLEAWIKPNHNLDGVGIQRIVRKGGYFLQVQNNTVFFFIQDSEQQHCLSMRKVSWRPKTWYHITGTYDGSEMEVYVNGELNNSRPLTGAIALVHKKATLGIGVFFRKGGYFDGVIDEVKVYNRALTEKQVKESYLKFGKESRIVQSSGNVVSNELAKNLEGERKKIYRSSLIKKISLLDNLVKEAENKGIDVSYQKVTLTTANVFKDLISKYSGIQTRKGILSDFVLEETDRIVEKAVRETKEIIENPSLQIKVPVSRIKKVSIKNGAFSIGNSPVFISGIFKKSTALKGLGANLAGPHQSPPINYHEWQYWRGEPTRNLSFNTGTHDWEYNEIIIYPSGPVGSLRIYPFLRRTHTGTAWFDDIYVGECKEGIESPNLVKCPGFESEEPWIWKSRGYKVDKDVKRTGKQSIRCSVGKTGGISGCMGYVYIGQKEAAPIKVSGWSRTKDVSGKRDGNYGLYLEWSYPCFTGWDRFNDSCFKNRIFPRYQKAAEEEFFLAPGLWEYSAPGWLFEIDPDINKGGWFRSFMDIDHPLIERVNKSWFSYLSSQLKKMPNHFCYSLMGEERCHASFRSKHTAKRYASWLKEKHKDIDGLNKAWGSDYQDFEQVSKEVVSKIASGGRVTEWLSYDLHKEKNLIRYRGSYYDWHRFNQYRLTTWNQWQIDGIKKEDPEALITCWPPAGGLITGLFGRYSRGGINWEDIITQCSVVGWDGALIPYEAAKTKRLNAQIQSAKYNLGWRNEIIYYDFAKSVAPEKPIFDPEWHTITSFKHRSPVGISADFLRTALWMEHLHGMGAHLAWGWGTRPKHVEFLGGLLTQPQLLESWGRTTLELRRLIKYIVLFPQLERRVKILYSEPSSIQDGQGYGNQLSNIYESLYFLDYPAGFITEKMIREGKLKECSLLVIPNCRYVNEETVLGIRKYLRKGGRVVINGKDSLKYDEYGKERDVSDFLEKDIYLKGSTAEEYSAQLDKIMDEVKIKREVRVLDKEGKNVWGVELRTASHKGKKIVYLINQNKHNVEIILKAKRRIKQVKDIVTNKMMNVGKLFILEPRKPMLLEIR